MTIELKQTLFGMCEQHIDQKIQMAQKNIHDAQSSANTETKSSAGDKYETGRAMMHLEKEKYTRQLAQALQLREQLAQLKPHLANEKIEFGALVKTSNGSFFISVGIGKIQIEKEAYFVMSLASPIAQALKGLKKGDKGTFRGQMIEILDVI